MRKRTSPTLNERHFGPVRFLPGNNGGRYPSCHSLYIEGEGILIDPASRRDRLAELKEKPGVREVWLSHWHEDHLRHLDLFDDLPLRISEADAPPLSNLDLFIDSYGKVGNREREFWRNILKEQFHFRPRKPDLFLEHGQVFHFPGITVEVIGSPGHTPGHVSLFFREPAVLFLGDYDLTPFGPWYGDVHSSIEGTIQSVNRLRSIPAKGWIAGHEQGVFEEEPGELWDRYLGVIDRREKKLLEVLERPRTLEDIVDAWIIYGKPREPESFYKLGERLHMKKHLEKLMTERTVEKRGETFVRIE